MFERDTLISAAIVLLLIIVSSAPLVSYQILAAKQSAEENDVSVRDTRS